MSSIEVDGYIGEIQKELYPAIIPSTINHLIYLYYDPWFKLELSPQTEHRYPNPIYYFSKKEDKEYIILSPFSDDFRECIKYDIFENKWFVFATYPDEINARCHALAIDEEKEILYISHGHDRIFVIYNFIDNKWIIISKNLLNASKYNIQQYIANATSLVLPNGEYHLLCNILTSSAHLKWSINENKFIVASINGIENNCYLFESCLVFIKKKEILMALGGYLSTNSCKGDTDCIWYAHYNGNNKKKDYEWNEFKLKLPNKALRISCVIAFDLVLIISDKTKIWILDLGNNHDEYQWIEPILNDDQYPNGCRLVLTKSNYLHFINCYKEKQIHSKIHLSRFIPSHIYCKYVEV